MKLIEMKSIYPISKVKYIGTMLTGRHYFVKGITIKDSEKKIEASEPLITISKNCFILTDIDPSIRKNNKRIPVIIKLLKDERNQDIISPGMKGYLDENDKEVTLMQFSPVLFVLGFKKDGQDIVLNLRKA